MQFEEQDIQFNKLTGSEFEELCFDLLWRMGFHSIVWRQGGGDSGRDIEALYSVTNPAVGTYDEMWFVECKNHISGISVEDLDSKLAWARAEKPQHLLIVISSYLTNPTRTWLKKITADTSFRIHLIEGKGLKTLMLSFPDIVAKYFIDEYKKLLRDTIQSWVIHGIYPNPETMFLIWDNIYIRKLSLEEIAFLYCTYIAISDDLERWFEENTIFSFEHLISKLAEYPNTETSILQSYPAKSCSSLTAGGGDDNNLHFLANITVQDGGSSTPAIYCHVSAINNEAIELLLFRRSDIKTIVHLVGSENQTERELMMRSLIGMTK